MLVDFLFSVECLTYMSFNSLNLISLIYDLLFYSHIIVISVIEIIIKGGISAGRTWGQARVIRPSSLGLGGEEG